MIDWSEYPDCAPLRRCMPTAELLMFEHILRDVQKRERKRCAEKCRRRAYQHGNPMGTAPQCVADEAFACAAAIEALGDNDA